VNRMKRLLHAWISLFVLTLGCLGQATETFDIATFRVPAGWEKKVKPDTVMFSNEKGDAFCMVTIYRSTPAPGNPDENFNLAWKAIVVDAVNVAEPSKMTDPQTEDGWEVRSGLAQFEKEGTKGVVWLINKSLAGRMVNVVILTNNSNYEKDYLAFLESITLKKPEASAPVPAATGGDATAIVGTWGAASSGQSQFEVNHGLSGYIKKQYTFAPDGTYEFLIKTFSYTSRHLLFTRETGTYQLSGNSLTITPQKSTIQAWTKGTVRGSDGRMSETDNWGNLASTQNRKLEKVTYRVSKEYFSGIQEWQLVMQAPTSNDRDGPFSSNLSFPNSWLYKVQKFPIEPPK